MSKIAAKTLRWLIFSVVLAVVPVAGALFMLWIKGKPHDLEFVLADGGAFLIIASICAAAIGEMVGSSPNHRLWKIICSGATMVLLLFSAIIFASIAEAKMSNGLDNGAIASLSTIVFICGSISAGACVALSET